MFPPPPWLATCDYNLSAAVAVAGGGRVPRPSRCHCANLMQFLSVSPWAPIDNSSPFGVAEEKEGKGDCNSQLGLVVGDLITGSPKQVPTCKGLRTNL